MFLFYQQKIFEEFVYLCGDNRKYMKKFFLYILPIFCFATFFTSCKDDEPIEPCDKTIIMYFPWSTDLTYYFQTNITDMESAIRKAAIPGERVVVFFASSQTEAELFEIVLENGSCVRKPLKNYQFSNNEYTTETGLTKIIADFKAFAPAESYSMIIGCHGLGWISSEAGSRSLYDKSNYKYHWEGQGFLTRFFGGRTADCQTELSTLAASIINNGIKMEYILFDDCYMANVETSYVLRNATDHLIASTSEIMARGLPYATVGQYLLGKPNYKAIVDGFYDFYSHYSKPYGALSVIDCSQIEGLASVVKRINNDYTFDSSKLKNIQKLDGYNPSIFFDCRSYMNQLCNDAALMNAFDVQLGKTVLYTACTPQLYSSSFGTFDIEEYSGITISDPSEHRWASEKQSTDWYKATH